VSRKQKGKRPPLVVEKAAKLMLLEKEEAGQPVGCWLGYVDVGSLGGAGGAGEGAGLAGDGRYGEERVLLGLMRAAQPWELLRRQPAAWWGRVWSSVCRWPVLMLISGCTGRMGNGEYWLRGSRRRRPVEDKGTGWVGAAGSTA